MKKWMVMLLAVACVLGLAGCMVNAVSFEIPEAAMIQLRSGNDGSLVEITAQDDIQQITENINALKFEKGYSSEDYTGWSYSITWYNSDGAPLEEITIMTDNQISYEGYFYVSIGAGIDTKYLDGLLGEG